MLKTVVYAKVIAACAFILLSENISGYSFWFCAQDSMSNIRAEESKRAFAKFRIHHKPYVDSVQQTIVLRNEHSSFARKFLLGNGLVFGYEAIALTILYASPYSFSKWYRPTPVSYRENMKTAFTKPPVIDRDYWYINYIGHPYQGACTYNAVRSQGAKFWQAGLFALGHSMVWEYLIESGNERPSVQDIVVTPVVGSLLGELIHQATVSMARNGYTWYEGIFVCVFNPMFAINNGFKFAGKPVPRARKN